MLYLNIDNYDEKSRKNKNERMILLKRKFRVISIIMAVILTLEVFTPIYGHADIEDSVIAASYSEDNVPPVVAKKVITTSNVTHNSVKLSWEPASDAVTDAAHLQYNVIFSKEYNIGTVTDAENNGTIAYSVTGTAITGTAVMATVVTDLTPDTTYYFNVIVQDLAGNKSVYIMKEQKTQTFHSGPRAVFGGENGTELFLGGNFIELGISNWGDFGTLGNKPDNFRGTFGGEVGAWGSNNIGMSADHDGYNNGRDLPIDYYLPGTPEERFVVGYKIGEKTFDNTNSAQMNSKNMPTTITNQSDIKEDLLKAEVISTWDGKMEITQIISFKANDKFYRNEVTLKNISGEAFDGARYMRSFDPDNTQFRGGPYETSNIVTHTIEEDNKAVVKAETYDDNDPLYKAFGTRAPIFFYSNNSSAVASIFGFKNTDPYVPESYDAPSPKGAEIIDDTAITMTWDSGPLAPEESKTFVYYTSLDERDFDEVQGEIIIADIEKDIEDLEDMDDVRKLKEKIDKEEIKEEKKEEFKSIIIDVVCGFPPTKDITIETDEDIVVLKDLINESDKDEDEKDDIRLRIVDKAIDDIGEENLTEEDKAALDEVIEDITDENKKAIAKSKLDGKPNEKAEIEEEIRNAENLEDIQEIYEKIKNSTMTEKDKEELKGKLVDRFLDEETNMDINGTQELEIMKDIIDSSNKENDVKDQAYEKLVIKGLNDLAQDNNLSSEEKEALKDIIEKVMSVEKKEELNQKLSQKEAELKGKNNGNDRGSTKPKDSSLKETSIIVNGKQEKAGVETVTEKNGQKIVEIRTDSDVLNQKIDEVLKENEGKTVNNLVEISVLSKDNTLVKGILTGDIIKKMERNDFSLSIKTENVDYVIPAKEIGIEQVASILGVKSESLKKIEIQIEIEKINEKQTKEIIEKGKLQGYEIVLPPVSFKVIAKTITDSGAVGEVTVSEFSDYVSRVMRVPEGIDPNKITTGIYHNQDGTFSHIPTEVFKKDTLWYAKLNSLTNSSYSVIWNPVTVASVENHWSKEYVNDMASRLVIRNPEDFIPDEFITRGEFAEYIVKALGLYRTGVAKIGKFTDVTESNGLADAITIATEYDIIRGYTDGTFKSNAEISREEAMTMYSRAMNIVAIEEVDNNKILSYADREQISSWAYDFVKKTVSANIFNGRTSETIDPKGTFTYAEAAAAIRNLLINAGLINQ